MRKSHGGAMNPQTTQFHPPGMVLSHFVFLPWLPICEVRLGTYQVSARGEVLPHPLVKWLLRKLDTTHAKPESQSIYSIILSMRDLYKVATLLTSLDIKSGITVRVTDSWASPLHIIEVSIRHFFNILTLKNFHFTNCVRGLKRVTSRLSDSSWKFLFSLLFPKNL